MNESQIADFLLSKIGNPYGVAGLMGNLYAESGLKFNAVERLCIRRLEENGKGVWTDESYTQAVDNGTISREEFLHPLPNKSFAYGLAQWTWHTRKAKLYDLCKQKNVSISDPETQLGFLISELENDFPAVHKVLRSASSVREASDIVLKKFESPADQSENVQKLRAGYGQKYYDKFAEVKNMAVLIGSARSNESGGINGGKAGDQTGGEVSTQNWYLHSKGWYVLRPKRPEVAEIIAKTMEGMCANNNFGYCQDHRLSGYNAAKEQNFDVTKVTKPAEIDCSEGVRICAAAAGIYVSDFYTGNEVEVLVASGEFELIDDPMVCNFSNYLERGDILVTQTKGHTVVVLSDGEDVIKQPSEGWKQASDGKRWWYQYADGTYPKGCWAWLHEVTGNTDGWYLFDSEGYMLKGAQIAPDGKLYYLCEAPGIDEGKCMVTDNQGALQIADWDKEKNRYAI